MAIKRHNKSSKRQNKSSKGRNGIKRSLSKGYNVAKTTTKKYAPKVKAELENVGSKVTVVAKKSVPFIQQSANKILGLFNKTKKNLKL
jgi:hypothetical protein